MRVCLLTQHPQLFTQQRLLAECRSLKLDVEVVTPDKFCWVWPNNLGHYDFTFNRLSSVESGAFEFSLSSMPVWGKQINSWEFRQKLWDKARQIIWLSELDIQAPTSFMMKGSLYPDHPSWKKFVKDHSSQLGWVLKFNRGQKGVGVNFVETEAALIDWMNTLYRMGDQDFLIQPRLAQSEEYRLTLLGGKPWCLLRREGAKGNFAQGGKATELEVKLWPKEIIHLIDKLSFLDESSYLALDILLIEQTPYVLDVNTMPGVEQLEQVSGRNFVKDLLNMTLKSL